MSDYLPNPYFGEPWDSPFCDTAPHADTPVGEPCGFCTLPILDGEQGVITPAVLADGVPGRVPWHRECWLRQIVGSPSHLRGTCTCHRGGVDVRPQTPAERRAEAAASAALLQQMG